MSNRNKETIRLNRFIAMCGICSRRKADALIENGQISVNNKIIYELGIKVSLKDVICFNGEQVLPEKKQYLLLNKPAGYITTMNDERGRKTVMSLIKTACSQRLVPVGRLDKDTTGLLLFTNDGLLAKKMMHPKHEIKKVYNVSLDRKLDTQSFKNIYKGIVLEDGLVTVDSIQHIDKSGKNITIEIHVGKNRIVRRIFEFFNYKVLKLDRIEYACLNKQNLLKGKWRMLTKNELRLLHRNN
jgi:23S rRNA pseudouridine2605 synthase